uniref:ubiquitinyl hydrolase 1 n=1 Tax=Albugo laibachii Nc14 TaxID=890382 RepID=F0W1J4_9STRA|nr:ubiquitinspecific protease putative [Albugo laibachii Nc14]|eukprot:CCA14923.1 ubiquitinspecific protease putative [Albugo laibachii Nc14]
MSDTTRKRKSITSSDKDEGMCILASPQHSAPYRATVTPNSIEFWKRYKGADGTIDPMFSALAIKPHRPDVHLESTDSQERQIHRRCTSLELNGLEQQDHIIQIEDRKHFSTAGIEYSTVQQKDSHEEWWHVVSHPLDFDLPKVSLSVHLNTRRGRESMWAFLLDPELSSTLEEDKRSLLAQYLRTERRVDLEFYFVHPSDGSNGKRCHTRHSFTTIKNVFEITLEGFQAEYVSLAKGLTIQVQLRFYPPIDPVTKEEVNLQHLAGMFEWGDMIMAKYENPGKVNDRCGNKQFEEERQECMRDDTVSGSMKCLPSGDIRDPKTTLPEPSTCSAGVTHLHLETSLIGLKNQGATCYINSLLQTLYHLLAFRHVVYEIPTQKEDTTDSVTLALQRVFYRLQCKTKAVSTKELTRSFGWSQIDAFMQHDVQELYRILCDRLEEKMSRTIVEGSIRKLFGGTVRSYVRCVDVDYESFRDESFYDLQLDVKGCSDIYASFRKYIAIEMLEGENQYAAEGFGKQNAKKAICFLDFPPILNLQLKRFEYDPMRDGMVKIHDRFAFPTKLVLDPFVEPTTKDEEAKSISEGTGKRVEYVYHLHSVLVHSGDVHGGHYYVYIRPGRDTENADRWYKFDDDEITSVTESEAVEGNFGGSLSPGISGYKRKELTRHPLDGSPLLTAALGSPDTHSEEDPSLNSDSGHLKGYLDGTPGLNRAPVLNHGENPDLSGTGMHGLNTSLDAEGFQAENGNNMMLPLSRTFSSAYMLVYIRDGINDISSVSRDMKLKTQSGQTLLRPISSSIEDVQIPQHLLQRFHEEEKITARRKKQQQTEHLYMTLRIASDWSIHKLKKYSKTTDFASFNNSFCLRLRMKRSASIRQLYYQVYRQTGVELHRLRLWRVILRENRTQRPDSPLESNSLDYRVECLIDEDTSTKAPVRLFLQILSGEKLRATAFINFYFWPTRTSQIESCGMTNELAKEDEGECLDIEDTTALNAISIPPIRVNEILLFIKYYDVKIRDLNERLKYMGNILIDATKTGAALAKHLHDALHLPYTDELILYEEIQPTSVVEVNMLISLQHSDIQHGDIICFQTESDLSALTSAKRQGSVLDTCAGWINPSEDEMKEVDELYPDVPSYFRYLLDRVDIAFQELNHPEKEGFVLGLLLSNVYRDIVEAVAEHLQLGPKRLHLRLYQHSSITGAPKRVPLRHSQYFDDRTTTLDDFLTEYADRTTMLYYEILPVPITELEAKMQLTIYLSTYDDCFDHPDTSDDQYGGPRHLDLMLDTASTLEDLDALLQEKFCKPSNKVEDDPEKLLLRYCEAIHEGSVIQRILTDGTTKLSKFQSTVAFTEARCNGDRTQRAGEIFLFVERVPMDEIQEISSGGSYPDTVAHLRVLHCVFTSPVQMWIHPHGVPLVVCYKKDDTIGQVKDRIRKRMGINADKFADWNIAYIVDMKVSVLCETYDRIETGRLNMAKLEEVCDGQLDRLSFGLEHPDPHLLTGKYRRRTEQGIQIRQS